MTDYFNDIYLSESLQRCFNFLAIFLQIFWLMGHYLYYQVNEIINVQSFLRNVRISHAQLSEATIWQSWFLCPPECEVKLVLFPVLHKASIKCPGPHQSGHVYEGFSTALAELISFWGRRCWNTHNCPQLLLIQRWVASVMVEKIPKCLLMSINHSITWYN